VDPSQVTRPLLVVRRQPVGGLPPEGGPRGAAARRESAPVVAAASGPARPARPGQGSPAGAGVTIRVVGGDGV
jgi:hypothetical protein